jgi:hypothetical protein
VSRKQQLTKAGQPRKRKPGAGRPSLGKVKMTVHILPATRQALGDKPGEVLDAHFGGSNDPAMPTASEKRPLT